MPRPYSCLWVIVVLVGVVFISGTFAVRADERNPFGIIEGFWVPDEACALGAGWERIIFDWAQHQPDSGDDWYTLNVDDRWLKAANHCGREVVAVIKHTPAWATDGTPMIGVPRGLYLPVDDPNNLWANFIRRAAEYYDSRGVERFIIWNEPDIEPGTYGYEFEGTLEDYYQLLRVAYLAAKQANPRAQINIAGTTYWHDVNAGRRLYLDRLLERISADPEAAANNYYFDAVNLHIYFRTETVYQIVSETRALLDRYGLTDKSIWLAETNAAPNLDPGWLVQRPNWQVDLEQQAAYVVQSAALALAAGADHIAVYKLYDQGLPTGAESFGILRPDGTRRPAFDAWHMVINRFSDATSGTFTHSATADVVRLAHTSGLETWVAWARTDVPTQITITATSDKAYLIDQTGSIMGIRPFNGVYTLSLPAARCNRVDGCAVGGHAALLVQGAGATIVHEMTPAGLVPLVGESS
ncbi:MAG: hypothetical protein IPO91_27600 [Chloroflexi bacterium]|nr:hypothetical protein [Chloroflexota bacterium]